MENEKAVKVYSGEGLEIYKIPFDKFKTNTISIYFHDDLTKEKAALNALLPAVLKQGSEKYPTRKDISIKLQELYGSIFEGGVSKKGELQLLYFYLETIRDSYANKDEKLAEEAFETMFEVLTKPNVIDGGFDDALVDVEKTNMKNYIESLLNDKMGYSMERCIEEMCKEEAFGIYELGRIEDYDKIDGKVLYQHYLKVLSELPVSIYITGQAEDSLINKVKDAFLSLKKANLKITKKTSFSDAPENTRYIEEKMDVNQGKLCMGFRTNVSPSSDDYYSLMVYNSILGGGLHSKLFQNVREKEGLAYSAFSRIERFKGLLVISAGIEMFNKDKVIDIINVQMEDMKKGNISDYEFSSSIKTIESSINSMKDSQISLSDFILGQNILGTSETLDSVIEKIKKVTKEDIIKISKVVIADTTYFLTGV